MRLLDELMGISSSPFYLTSLFRTHSTEGALYIYTYMHVYNLCLYFKLKSVYVIQNIYFHFLLLSKINIILCSKCILLLRMCKKIPKWCSLLPIVASKYMMFSTMLSHICAKLYHRKLLLYYNPFFNIEKQNFTHIINKIHLW